MFALFIALLLQAPDPVPSPVRLFPIDDSSREPGFSGYVGKLQAAVASRDTGALRKLVDKEVVVGPGKDDKGWDKFVVRWRPEEGTGPLWGALGDLLSLGFVREHPQLYLSPYLVWRFPRDLNMGTHLVVVRDKSALREDPSLRAPVVEWLSFDVVRRIPEAAREEGLVRWVRVGLLDGRTGYVNSGDLMSPLMPRAQFGLRGRRWLMTGLEGPDR